MFFISINLSPNTSTQNAVVVARSNYNPLNDSNISGITTNNGNWIKKKVFVVDFLNNKKFFRPKKNTRQVMSAEIAYSYPGDYPIQYGNPVWTYDSAISIGGNFFGFGGTDSAIFEMNLNIPWVDLKSWLDSNYTNEKKSKIKSIYLVPEIQLTNPPLNSATVTFGNIQINNQQLYNHTQTSNIVIPKEMEYSQWTASDVLGLILGITGFTLSGVGLTSGVGVAASAGALAILTVREVKDILTQKDSKYHHTKQNQNQIKVASNIKMEEGKDLNINIPTIKITGERSYGYWSDHTEATMSNLYVLMELE